MWMQEVSLKLIGSVYIAQGSSMTFLEKISPSGNKAETISVGLPVTVACWVQ